MLCSGEGKRRPGGSSGSLPPDGWLIVTCELTACTPGSAPGTTLGKEHGKPLPFLLLTEAGWKMAIKIVMCTSPGLSKKWITEQLRLEGRDHVLHRPTTLAYLHSAGTDQCGHQAVDCVVSAHGSCTAGQCEPDTGWLAPRWLVQQRDQMACELQNAHAHDWLFR